MLNEDKINEAKTIMDVNPRLVTKRRKDIPSSTDPREELRKLIRQHKALTRSSVAITSMASDRTNRTTGEKIECPLLVDVQIKFKALADDVAKKTAKALEGAMLRQLKQIPVYKQFLSKVYGVGP